MSNGPLLPRQSGLNRLPTKWLLAFLAIAIAYSLLQPMLKQRLGWNLPSVAELTDSQNPTPKSEKPLEQPKPSPQESDSTAATTVPSPPIPTQPVPTQQTTASKDFLESIGRDVYRSPAGLVYKRGSAEGHRLKHIERHLEDQPNRPGSHGVFEGDSQEFLRLIDETYRRAKSQDKGTKSYMEEGRNVYEATFPQALGYLGGQEGKRRKNPVLKRIRVVVDGDSVITAFPF